MEDRLAWFPYVLFREARACGGTLSTCRHKQCYPVWKQTDRRKWFYETRSSARALCMGPQVLPKGNRVSANRVAFPVPCRLHSLLRAKNHIDHNIMWIKEF